MTGGHAASSGRYRCNCPPTNGIIASPNPVAYHAVMTLTEKIFIGLQTIAPARLLGRLVYRLSRAETRWFKNGLIRLFVRLFAVDVTEADADVPAGYTSLNAFFTRALTPGARPVDSDPAAIVSPVDGIVQQIGMIRDGAIVQAKHLDYRVDELLDRAAGAVKTYDSGTFATIYLAPHDYHRVHAPCGGHVVSMAWAPGRRLAVNPMTARNVAGLFTGNERVICELAAPSGPFAVVMVGALNVGFISTTWHGPVRPVDPAVPQRWRYSGTQRPELGKGAELGRFELGSTVILLLPPNRAMWLPSLAPGTALKMGRRIGTLISGLERPGP